MLFLSDWAEMTLMLDQSIIVINAWKNTENQ